MQNKGYRKLIREFLKAVEWANHRNVSFLINGTATYRQSNWADTEMAEMVKAKRTQPADQIKKLLNERYNIYATISSDKKDKGNKDIEHDLKLRDVLAKFLFDRAYQGMDKLSVKRIQGNPDAHLGNIYFELDNGHEEDKTLREKLERYAGPGAFQVIFIMAHRYGDKGLESARLEKIQRLGNEVLRCKPNRILSATYHGYLEDGKLYNLRNEERSI